MSKTKKKRNKKYQGADAAVTKPTITRVSAVNRSRLGQWWFDHKKLYKPLAIAGAVVSGLVALIVGFITSIN